MTFYYCSRSSILEMVSNPQVKKQTEQPHENKRKKETLRERFIKNKRSLNLVHISPKKEKEP